MGLPDQPDSLIASSPRPNTAAWIPVGVHELNYSHTTQHACSSNSSSSGGAAQPDDAAALDSPVDHAQPSRVHLHRSAAGPNGPHTSTSTSSQHCMSLGVKNCSALTSAQQPAPRQQHQSGQQQWQLQEQTHKLWRGTKVVCSSLQRRCRLDAASAQQHSHQCGAKARSSTHACATDVAPDSTGEEFGHYSTCMNHVCVQKLLAHVQPNSCQSAAKRRLQEISGVA